MSIFTSYWQCGFIIKKWTDEVNQLKCNNVYRLVEIDAYSGETFLYWSGVVSVGLIKKFTIINRCCARRMEMC